MTPRDGLIRSMGLLTAFMINTTMALVGDGTLLGPRRFDMGESGLGQTSRIFPWSAQ